MKVFINDLADSAECMWCEKTTEVVSVQFDGSFLSKGHLCWKCLQQATRVHHRQQASITRPSSQSPKGE